MNSTRDWEIIANYESFELVKRDYFTRHGREPNTQHAREIAAPFSHARSYFRSAHGAELTVKPLLLYYGVVSLSRGLTLLLSRGLREVALTPNHGLSATGWLAIVSKTKPNFAELRVKVTGGGTLMDLSKATEHRSLLRSGSSAVNWKEVCPPLSSGMEFGFGELLSRIPLLQDHYVRWTNETNCAPLECVTGNPGEAITLKLLRYGKNYLNQNVAAKIFDRTPYQFMSEDTDAIYYSGPSNTDDGPGLTDSINVDFGRIGQIWATANMPGSFRLSKIISLFGLAYVLGMLVRYFPTQWTALVRGQIDDAALPTLSAAVEFIEANFPITVVDFLQEKPE